MKLLLCLTLPFLLTACSDTRLTVTGPTVTNNNTNTNTLNNDSHDVITFSPTFPIPGSSTTNPTTGETETPLPVPLGSQAQAAQIASTLTAEILKSCQATDGAEAWKFLDTLVAGMRMSDPRWGYFCKRNNCADISGDVIAYRATNDNSGAWAIDVINAHCPGPTDKPAFQWLNLGYDAAALWKQNR